MVGVELDGIKRDCEDILSSNPMQRDCENLLLFGNQSRCETSAVGTLLVVHEALNSGPKWTETKGSKETVRPFLRRL